MYKIDGHISTIALHLDTYSCLIVIDCTACSSVLKTAKNSDTYCIHKQNDDHIVHVQNIICNEYILCKLE